ncbi:MAG: hypothetical protein K5883_02745 [Pseudobutyrivibrio sp.]|nr:hypothetical protein [Pseudobutyrivibrio sp.]
MKNKKDLIVCILAIVIVAICIAIGVNVSASNKYATAMELIEAYKGNFDSNDELDSKQAVYDSFVGDSTLNGYYGSNDSFDESYDSTKEYFEGEIINLEAEIAAVEAEIEQTQNNENDSQESLETETDDSENTESEDVQASDEQNASSDTNPSDTKNENTTSSNETASNEQQTSNNTESTDNSSSSNSSSSVEKLTATGYRPDLGQLVTFYAPDEINKLHAQGCAVEWNYIGGTFTVNGRYGMSWYVPSKDLSLLADSNGDIIWDFRTMGEDVPFVQY